MAENTMIHQGRFTADGENVILRVRSDIDWMRVSNLTNIAGTTQYVGTEWKWMRGFAANDAITWYHAAASQALSQSTCAVGYNGAVYGGITLIDSSVTTPLVPVATTANTNVVAPVVDTGDTTGITVGTIIRLSSIAATPNICGIDFEVGAVTLNTDFTIRWNLANAPGAAGGAGFYRIIPYDPIFYPRMRTVCNITQAASAVVTTTVSNQMTRGSRVRFTVPAACGMVEADGVEATVTAVTANNFTVNMDSTAFTAFAWPVAAGYVAFTPAQVKAIGEDTPAIISGSLPAGTSATEDTSFIGIQLTTSPDAAIALGSAGGSANDVMYWIAGKSFNVNNE